MNIHLHANATTTPKTRQYIQASQHSVPQLADELGVSEDTIRRWKRRDAVADGSHTPHRLQPTASVSPASAAPPAPTPSIGAVPTTASSSA